MNLINDFRVFIIGGKMKVLNFGSLNIDYVYDVFEFVKKGETITSKSLSTYPGGKGLNQSVALANSGCFTYHAGIVGKEGRFLIDVLKNAGVNVDNVIIDNNAKTGHAVIQRDAKGDNCIILFAGANRQIERPFIDEVFSKFNSGDYLVIQNEVSNLKYIVEKAKETGMTIILNPSPMDEKVLELNLDLIDYFILNENEAQKLSGYDSFSLTKVLNTLTLRYKNAGVLITLGADGSIFSMNNKTVRQEAFLSEVVDTTGAGDTFTGYFVAGLIAGNEIEDILRTASIAASIAVSREGAAVSIPKMQEVKEYK